MQNLVTIVVLIVPFVFVITMVWLGINAKQKRDQLQADLYAKALEKGLPIPENLFVENKKKERKPLNTGIILISVSIGIMLSLWLLFNSIAQAFKDPDLDFMPMLALVGLIPFMAGVAFVIIHFVEKKRTPSEDAK